MSKRTYRNHTHPTGAKFVSAYYYIKEQRRTLLSQRNGPAGAAFDRVANDYGLPLSLLQSGWPLPRKSPTPTCENQVVHVRDTNAGAKIKRSEREGKGTGRG